MIKMIKDTEKRLKALNIPAQGNALRHEMNSKITNNNE
jgi:hypothetical protein